MLQCHVQKVLKEVTFVNFVINTIVSLQKKSRCIYKKKLTPNHSKNTLTLYACVDFQGFTYPPHVGLSIGTAADPQFVLMEVHYDNPSYTEGLYPHTL